MQPVSGLRFLVAAAALALAALAGGCTVKNVNIRPPDYEGGSTHIFGEIENPTGGYAKYVQVKGALLDAQGTVIASPTFWTCSSIIKPNDTLAFGTYYNGTSPIANYDLKVESIPMAPVPDANLEISGLQVNRGEDDRLHIVGLVTNTGSEGYEGLRVCAAFYDSSGKVDGFLLNYAADVGPGQRASFDVFTSPFGGEPSSHSVSYRVWVQPTGGTSFMDRGYVSTDKLALR
jgi:hypothetical protein